VEGKRYMSIGRGDNMAGFISLKNNETEYLFGKNGSTFKWIGKELFHISNDESFEKVYLVGDRVYFRSEGEETWEDLDTDY